MGSRKLLERFTLLVTLVLPHASPQRSPEKTPLVSTFNHLHNFSIKGATLLFVPPSFQLEGEKNKTFYPCFH